MPDCLGFHYWSGPYLNLYGEIIVECFLCGRTQHYYPLNMIYLPELDEYFQCHQQGQIKFSEEYWYG